MTDKAHARFSASAAERWINCPASVPLSDGLPNKSSAAAAEGTEAHDVAEHAVSVALGLRTPSNKTSSPEMLAGAGMYLSTVEAYRTMDARIELEVQSPSLAEIDKELGGTTDCRIYIPSSRKIVVIDYKFGKGYAVEAIGNRQMLTYALGALLDAPIDEAYDEIEMCIVQPRAYHGAGPVRRWCVTVMEVLQHLDDVKGAIEIARADTHKPKPGDHCTFCLARLTCPALTAAADFATDHAETTPANAYNEGELAEMLDRADIAEMWIKAVRAEADNRAAAGKKIPGYKTVSVNGTRKWTDEAAAADMMRAKWKLADDRIFERSIVSVATAEKMFGKAQMHMLADVITKKAAGRGWKLVPVSEEGDEIAIGPQADFGCTNEGN